MNKLNLSEVLQSRYFEFQSELREAKSGSELVQCLVRHLAVCFKAEGVGVIKAKRVGNKLLVEEELLGDAFPAERDFSEVSVKIKEVFGLFPQSDGDMFDPSFLFNVSGISYQVPEIFEQNNHLIHA